jgi:hypothetical protein
MTSPERQFLQLWAVFIGHFGAGGGDRTRTPLAGPRILIPSECNLLARPETRVRGILAQILTIVIQAFAASPVGALAQC